MTPPTVSVAIATYNRSRMVCEAIESALAQTLPPMEICVVDDASTDTTWAALQSVAARNARVRIFQQEKNTGGVGNWNAAIGRTQGGYIAWCSDDDRFLPGHLEASAGYLEQNPEIGMAYSGFVDAVESGNEVILQPRRLRFAKDRVLDRRGLVRYLTRYYDWPFHPSTIVMRREVWEQVGPFDPQYTLADTDWFVRAVEQFPAAMLARDGVVNRRHPGNWSNRVGSAAMQREISAIVERSIERIYSRVPLRRFVWLRLWRANVCLRLLLTVRVRIRTGHVDAACSAWSQIFDKPSPLQRLGIKLIRRVLKKRTPQFEDPRQSVSPL